jgi:hypothetical protein
MNLAGKWMAYKEEHIHKGRGPLESLSSRIARRRVRFVLPTSGNQRRNLTDTDRFAIRADSPLAFGRCHGETLGELSIRWDNGG